jgi:hypothetical protein
VTRYHSVVREVIISAVAALFENAQSHLQLLCHRRACSGHRSRRLSTFVDGCVGCPMIDYVPCSTVASSDLEFRKEEHSFATADYAHSAESRGVSEQDLRSQTWGSF